ncbi:MAG: hypothetical protein ACRD5D_03265 [Candidatus Polarisedimenticolia bacterium]
MNRDLEHLGLLSLFHFVLAGLTFLASLFPLAHLFMGIAMVTGRLPGGPRDPAMRAFGWAFVAAAGLLIAAGMTFSLCLAAAGRCLRRHRRYLYCLVMAGVACILPPLGTVLGVFTLLVLRRDSVKRLFGRLPAAPAVPAP